jgi:regulator of cell morphogenesis and NO signaling
MIRKEDKLSDVICRNIDLFPVVYRFGIKSEIRQKDIAEICAEKGIETAFFLAVLNTFDSGDFFPRPADIEIGPLIGFLVSTHAYHKEVTIPYVAGLVERLKAESADKKFVLLIERYFNDYVQKLLRHIAFEESEIFPLVEAANRNRPEVSKSYLRDLFSQHENVESEITDLLTIIIRHVPENSNIRLIHDVLHALSHFEKEQVDHARFEEKILVPKLIALFR